MSRSVDWRVRLEPQAKQGSYLSLHGRSTASSQTSVRCEIFVENATLTLSVKKLNESRTRKAYIVHRRLHATRRVNSKAAEQHRSISLSGALFVYCAAAPAADVAIAIAFTNANADHRSERADR